MLQVRVQSKFDSDNTELGSCSSYNLVRTILLYVLVHVLLFGSENTVVHVGSTCTVRYDLVHNIIVGSSSRYKSVQRILLQVLVHDMNLFSKYYCGFSSWNDLQQTILLQIIFTATARTFIMSSSDDDYMIDCCGFVSAWDFHVAANTGTLYAQVWRRSGTDWQLVNQNAITLTSRSTLSSMNNDCC